MSITPAPKRVRNLVAWSGHDFSYLPGDHIELPHDIATARIAAGLAAEPDGPGYPDQDNSQLKLALDAAHEAHAARGDELAAALAYVEALKGQIKALGEEPVVAPVAAAVDDDKTVFLAAVDAAKSKQALRDLGALNDVDLAGVEDKMVDLATALKAHADKTDRNPLRTADPDAK